MVVRSLGLVSVLSLVVGAVACSGESGGATANGISGSGGASSSTAGTAPATGGSSVVPGAGSGGNGQPTAGVGGGTSAAGTAPSNGGGSLGNGGTSTSPQGGTAAGGGNAGGTSAGGSGNPGSYPDPPRPINVTRTTRISFNFNATEADPGATGGQHTGEFDPSKGKLQKKLVLPFGGVNSDPWKMGWAVDRGYHVLTVDLWNDYPKDPGYPEYLESWSGEDKSTNLNQPKNNGVMERVKAGLTFLAANDVESDWGYYLDAQGEVRWNDVILFGYSWGGQLGVAASKYVAMDRIIITSAPNVPIDSPWLKQPNITPPERCFFLGGNKDGEHPTHKAETLLLGWPGDVINVTHMAPPYASNRLEVDDGHSSFCGRPFNDGMVDWDSICEFMFHTQK
ncbi:MAG TPA: hypothetical protein VHB79_05695 [Polyangiaceae bacterium]|nr:hypothetical protein [Polyangiaceae bacterium]